MAKRTTKRVAVIGGGLSGLTAGYELAKNDDFLVDLFEGDSRVGGNVKTENAANFIYELGPQSMQSKHDEVEDLVRDLDLTTRKVSRVDKKLETFVVRDGKLVRFAPTPSGFFGTGLISLGSKLGVFLEPFKGKSKGPDQSIYDFCKHRFGQEITDYMVDPVFATVNGASIKVLSAKHAFSAAWNAEQSNGSITLGMFGKKPKRKYPSKELRATYSYDDGLEVLPQTLLAKTKARVHTGKKVTKICRTKDGKWDLGNWAPYDSVVSTVPTYALENIGTCNNVPLRELFHHLSQIRYSALSILFVGFDRAAFKVQPRGFGCVAPMKENRDFVGMAFTSANFKGRSADDTVGVNVFIGGGNKPKQALISQDAAVAVAKEELGQLYGLSGEPLWSSYRQWPRAIPQYELGHEHYLKAMDAAEETFPGLVFGGNYRDGIGVPDAIRSGVLAARRAVEQLRRSD